MNCGYPYLVVGYGYTIDLFEVIKILEKHNLSDPKQIYHFEDSIQNYFKKYGLQVYYEQYDMNLQKYDIFITTNKSFITDAKTFIGEHLKINNNMVLSITEIKNIKKSVEIFGIERDPELILFSFQKC
jgi:hypothetical protein